MTSTVLSAGNKPAQPIASARLQSVDLLRGAVMVLMAIDHVRVYSGLPAGGPDAGIFFTRWVTHFCAPAFVFLAGTSAFLYGLKLNSKGLLARYLVTRGLLLVVLELTLIRLFWTFNLHYSQFVLAGVIWMLGWCMVLMAAFVWLRSWIAGITGLVIILAQQLFQQVPHILPQPAQATVGRFWEFIYPAGFESWPGITILYVLVPWIGVMLAGYGFGTILLMDPVRRRRICLVIGLSAIGIFVIAGSCLIIFGAEDAEAPPFLFRLLNQRKYPPSQLYLLMTLGPVIALVPFAERVRGRVAAILRTFGQVPMFYYLLHILFIHVSALVVRWLQEGVLHPEWYATAPYTSVPEANRWGLPLLYLVFVVNVALLYAACRWYAQYKQSHREMKWLKYL